MSICVSTFFPQIKAGFFYQKEREVDTEHVTNGACTLLREENHNKNKTE